MTNQPTLKQKRELTLQYLDDIFTEIWGPKCEENDGRCPACVSWAIYDCVEKLTDTAVLDIADEQQKEKGK